MEIRKRGEMGGREKEGNGGVTGTEGRKAKRWAWTKIMIQKKKKKKKKSKRKRAISLEGKG